MIKSHLLTKALNLLQNAKGLYPRHPEALAEGSPMESLVNLQQIHIKIAPFAIGFFIKLSFLTRFQPLSVFSLFMLWRFPYHHIVQNRLVLMYCILK